MGTIMLAMGALSAARADDWEAAQDMMQRLADVDSPEVGSVAASVVLWVDALRIHMLGGRIADKIELIGPSEMMAHETGERFVIGSAKADTELDPALLWASEIVDARMTRDRRRFERAWRAAPSDPEEFGGYVWAVLNCVAATMNTTKFGSATEGVHE